MSLLIKNLDMPTEGELLCIDIHPDGKVCVNLDLSCTKVGTAVSVPTPHGRLIDADKLKADNPRHMNLDVPYVTEETVEEIIEEAPTIIVAEEGK